MTQTLSGDTELDLPEFDAPPICPMPLLEAWLARAESRKVREPRAVVLATASHKGHVSTRVVLLKAVEHQGLVFTTSATSRKGTDLSENPNASINFYWRELLQQVSVGGQVERLGADESDKVFADRPIAAQATTSVSRQSEELVSLAALRAEAARLVDSGEPIARPTNWWAYLLVPNRIEFWYGSPDRLHKRIGYQRSFGEVAWTSHKLQP